MEFQESDRIEITHSSAEDMQYTSGLSSKALNTTTMSKAFLFKGFKQFSKGKLKTFKIL